MDGSKYQRLQVCFRILEKSLPPAKSFYHIVNSELNHLSNRWAGPASFREREIRHGCVGGIPRRVALLHAWWNAQGRKCLKDSTLTKRGRDGREKRGTGVGEARADMVCFSGEVRDSPPPVILLNLYTAVLPPSRQKGIISFLLAHAPPRKLILPSCCISVTQPNWCNFDLVWQEEINPYRMSLFFSASPLSSCVGGRPQRRRRRRELVSRGEDGCHFGCRVSSERGEKRRMPS